MSWISCSCPFKYIIQCCKRFLRNKKLHYGGSFVLQGFYFMWILHIFSYYNVYLLFFTVDICCQTNFVRKNRFCHQLCHMVYLLKKVLLFKPFKGTVSHDFYPFYEKALPGPQMIRLKRFCEILRFCEDTVVAKNVHLVSRWLCWHRVWSIFFYFRKIKNFW